ncbi:hypothetical protein EON82_12445 [bacterium]|nr:MAG: hypothetical protein EON82_12445 [bacterium]
MLPILAAALILNQTDWKPFTLGPVKIDLPAVPKLKKENGGSTWTVQTPDGLVVVVTVNPIFSINPPLTLAMAALGAADSKNGRIVEQKDLMLSGWPGIAATVQPKDLPTGRLQAYHLADRMVFVMAVGDDKSVDRLMGSIALNATAGTGPLKAAGPTWHRLPLKPFAPSVELPGTPELQLNRFPGVENPGRRFVSAYGNREYAVVYIRLPAGMTDEDRQDAVSEANTNALQTSGGKLVKRSKATMGGLPGERVEATVLEGRSTIFIQTAMDGDLLVILTAHVPTALNSSPELLAFLDSYRPAKPLPAKE